MPQSTNITITQSEPDFFVSPFDVEKGEIDLIISFDPQLLASFCTRYDLLSFTQLEARIKADRWHKKGITIKGTVASDYVQKCVLSLKPIHQKKQISVEQYFVRGGEKAESALLDFDPLEKEPPEELTDGQLNLADFILECFALDLDLYPRLQDEEIDNRYKEGDQKGQKSKKPSPFEVLKTLKRDEE